MRKYLGSPGLLSHVPNNGICVGHGAAALVRTEPVKLPEAWRLRRRRGPPRRRRFRGTPTGPRRRPTGLRRRPGRPPRVARGPPWTGGSDAPPWTPASGDDFWGGRGRRWRRRRRRRRLHEHGVPAGWPVRASGGVPGRAHPHGARCHRGVDAERGPRARCQRAGPRRSELPGPAESHEFAAQQQGLRLPPLVAAELEGQGPPSGRVAVAVAVRLEGVLR